MSIAVMNRVWRCSKAHRGELLIMLAVADFANDDGEAWPSVQTLGAKSRLCERETRYALRRLEHSGELKTLRNKGPRGCHLYQITIKEPQGAEIAGGQEMPGAVCDTRGAVCDTLGGHNTAPEPSVNRHKNRHTSTQIDSAFIAQARTEKAVGKEKNYDDWLTPITS